MTNSPTKRVGAFFIIVFLAMVFPWWVWSVGVVIVTFWLRPYWEGVPLVIVADTMYGGLLDDVALFSIGDLGVRLWMLYLVLFGLSLVWVRQKPRSLY